MCYITQEDIDNGSVVFLENGSLKFQGKTYRKNECELEEGISFPQKMEELEAPRQASTVEPKQKKEKKQKAQGSEHPRKLEHKAQPQEDAPEEKTEEPSKDDTMTAPLLAPQDTVGSTSTTAQPSSPQMSPEQLQLLLQTLVQQAQPHSQPQAQVHASQPAQPLTIPTPAQPTGTELQKNAVPEELHLFKQFMELTGGNALVALLLVVAVVYMKFLRGKSFSIERSEEKNKEQDEKIEEHTDACDSDRQQLTSRISQAEAKLSGLETKMIKLNTPEDRTKRLIELEKRIAILEESLENGLDLGLSDEVEERLAELEKQLKQLGKPSVSTKTSPSKKSTRVNKAAQLEDSDETEEA